MDLHDLKPGDMIINSIGQEAIVQDVHFFDKDARIIFDKAVIGWLDDPSSHSWIYRYNGKFLKATGDRDETADIVKVIKHD